MAEDLTEERIVVIYDQYSTKRCRKILEVVETDRTEKKEYQDGKNVLTRGLVESCLK